MPSGVRTCRVQGQCLSRYVPQHKQLAWTQRPEDEGDFASGLERKHRVGERSLGAGPALPLMIFETREKLLSPLGFIYPTLKWNQGLPALTFYNSDFSSTLSTIQHGIVRAISRACVHLYGMCLLPLQHNEFSHKLHVQRTAQIEL